MSEPRYSDRTAFSPEGQTMIDLHFSALTGLDFQYIRGFADAADHLIEALLANTEKRPNSHIVLAACYLFRHYLELQCKYLLEAVWHLHNHGTYTPKLGHPLRELWDATRNAVEPEIADSTKVPFDSVQDIIYQFHEADPLGQEFRYARTTKGQQSLRSISPQFSVEKLQAAMHRARTFLDQWAWELDMRFDSENFIDQ